MADAAQMLEESANEDLEEIFKYDTDIVNELKKVDPKPKVNLKKEKKVVKTKKGASHVQKKTKK